MDKGVLHGTLVPKVTFYGQITPKLTLTGSISRPEKVIIEVVPPDWGHIAYGQDKMITLT